LKLLDPDLAQDADEVHRFRLEYRALYQLSHPASELDAAASGVVRAEDLGFVDGRPYYTMELLRGETLSARIQRARLGPLEVVTLGEALAGILERMHRRGVIHRDLKPNNIFLVDDDLTRVKILDLGVAKLSPTFYSTTWRYQTPASQRLQTRPGVVVGHPEYMAPERLTEGSSSDPRVDIYSLGALLYEALTGSPRARREQTPMGLPRE
ncbi:MAG: serine/threonine protein kinase, partial [Planctomycetes bacterium]|nr:serine/threonine protein kinase [Planctomycetota bacterium]